MKNEEIIEFNANDELLSGIINRAGRTSSEQPDFGIVFANAGARGRLGSSFQYPYYARKLAEKGIPSLRFDPHGVGDSTGHIENRPMLEFYGALQQGLFVDDLKVAIELFKRQLRPKKLILCGVCGGAITSLIAAKDSNFVDGLILLSLPVLLDSVEGEESSISGGYAKDYLVSAYGKKIFSVDAWKRLVSGKSEIDTIKSYSKAILRDGIDRARMWADPRSVVDILNRKLSKKLSQRKKVEHSAQRHPMFNNLFLESLDSLMARDTPCLFIFGEGDAIRWHFEEHFIKPFWNDDPAYEKFCKIHYLPGCNHLFTLKEWQNQALDLIFPWLS